MIDLQMNEECYKKTDHSWEKPMRWQLQSIIAPITRVMVNIAKTMSVKIAASKHFRFKFLFLSKFSIIYNERKRKFIKAIHNMNK